MPPRPPPTPTVLTLLCSLAAAAAAWGAVRLDALLRQVLAPLLAGTWPVVVASLVVVAAGLAVFVAVRLVRAAGWLRGLALGGLVVALVWVPTALAASLLPRGAGPAATLYRSLGDPPAGRWAALALAVLLMALLAGPLSRAALGTARGWMRADAADFRRRLVRVVAGWPAAGATAVLLAGAGGWGRTAWAAVWSLLVLATLHVRTR